MGDGQECDGPDDNHQREMSTIYSQYNWISTVYYQALRLHSFPPLGSFNFTTRRGFAVIIYPIPLFFDTLLTLKR